MHPVCAPLPISTLWLWPDESHQNNLDMAQVGVDRDGMPGNIPMLHLPSTLRAEAAIQKVDSWCHGRSGAPRLLPQLSKQLEWQHRTTSEGKYSWKQAFPSFAGQFTISLCKCSEAGKVFPDLPILLLEYCPVMCKIRPLQWVKLPLFLLKRN